AGGAGDGRRGGDTAVAQVAPAVLLGVAFGEGAAPIVAPQAAIGVGEYLPPGAVVPQQGTAGDPRRYRQCQVIEHRGGEVDMAVHPLLAPGQLRLLWGAQQVEAPGGGEA